MRSGLIVSLDKDASDFRRAQKFGRIAAMPILADALAANGTVLISWEHEAIPELGNLITGNNMTCPQKWHGSRFDLVWVFNRPSSSARWTFAQVPQLLLPGDSAEIAAG
jgi:hypothetical protein